MKRFALGFALTCFAFSANAADIIASKDNSVIADPTFSWNGFYVGGQVGWIHNNIKYGQNGDGVYGSDTTTIMYTEGPYDRFKMKDDSFSGGLYGGYNFKINKNWLLGVEGDIAWFQSDDNHREFDDNVLPHPGQRNYLLFDQKIKTKQSAALRARLGYTNDRYMLYAAAGLAIARVDYRFTMDGLVTDYPTTEKDNQTLTGYTVGGGVEYALTNHILLRSEYRFTDYSDKEYSFSGNFIKESPSFNVDYKTHDIRLGVAYKF